MFDEVKINPNFVVYFIYILKAKIVFVCFIFDKFFTGTINSIQSKFKIFYLR